MPVQLPLPSEMNTLVTLKAWTDVPDGGFGVDATFSAGVQLWCKKEPVGATIYYGSMQTGQQVTHRFIARHREGITVEHVLEDTRANRRYYVRRVTDINGMRRFISIECEEREALA